MSYVKNENKAYDAFQCIIGAHIISEHRIPAQKKTRTETDIHMLMQCESEET